MIHTHILDGICMFSPACRLGVLGASIDAVQVISIFLSTEKFFGFFWLHFSYKKKILVSCSTSPHLLSSYNSSPSIHHSHFPQLRPKELPPKLNSDGCRLVFLYDDNSSAGFSFVFYTLTSRQYMATDLSVPCLWVTL